MYTLITKHLIPGGGGGGGGGGHLLVVWVFGVMATTRESSQVV